MQMVLTFHQHPAYTHFALIGGLMSLLIDTPFLNQDWHNHPSIIGKMTDENWVYMNLEDSMQSCVRGCLFTVRPQDKDRVTRLSEDLNENDLGCQFAMVICTIGAATMIVAWESYASCKQTILDEQFIEKLDRIKCDFYLTHIGSSTSTYRECIRKQISPKEKIQTRQEKESLLYLNGDIQVKADFRIIMAP